MFAPNSGQDSPELVLLDYFCHHQYQNRNPQSRTVEERRVLHRRPRVLLVGPPVVVGADVHPPQAQPWPEPYPYLLHYLH